MFDIVILMHKSHAQLKNVMHFMPSACMALCRWGSLKAPLAWFHFGYIALMLCVLWHVRFSVHSSPGLRPLFPWSGQHRNIATHQFHLLSTWASHEHGEGHNCQYCASVAHAAVPFSLAGWVVLSWLCSHNDHFKASIISVHWFNACQQRM